MGVSVTKKIETIDILRDYHGENPYILSLKNEVCNLNRTDSLNDFSIEYIHKNKDTSYKVINKIVKIADWFSKKKIEEQKWESSFIPENIKIILYIGETTDFYHLSIQYKQNMKPYITFIPKSAILNDFMSEDYHNLIVDFDRYDRITLSKDANRRLKAHQKEAVKFLISRRKCILADQMGLGKTTELSVAAIEGNFDSVVIICPASLKTNWKSELMWYVPEHDISIIEGFVGKNKNELEKYLGYGVGKSNKTISELTQEAKSVGKWNERRFVIVNFDILDDIYQIPKGRSNKDIQEAYENSPLLKFIKDRKSLLIVDESHRLSNMKSKQYCIIKDLIKRGNPESIYLATGTPITNTPQNFYNMLYLLGENITNDWKWFMKRYCGAIEICKDKKERDYWTSIFLSSKNKMSWYELSSDEKNELNEYIKKHCKMITIMKEATNIEELRDRTAHIYLRRTKEDINEFDIVKNVHEVFYDFTDEQQKDYDLLWEEYEKAQKELDCTKEINKDLLEGAIYRRYCSNQMVSNTIKMADDFISKGEKVILICCYDDELYALKEYYGDKCVIYNGKMSSKEKDNAKNEFTNNNDKMVFIGNLISCGVGINLVVSHILIFNNFDYVSGNNIQCEDRIYRIGQKKDCDVYYQMFRNTQYEKIWNIQLKKETIIRQIIKKEDEK